MEKTTCISALAIVALTLFGCAAPPAKPDPRDPWERMNRSTYKFNDTIDRQVAQPIARGYRKVAPRFVRTGVANFIENLQYPIVIVNDLLQAQFKPFCNDVGRLVMNTTVGIGGLLDPASAAGLDKNERDFGQTLGKWGVQPGPYLVVPFLGPSDVRDGVGYVGDEFTSPRHYINNNAVNYSLLAVRILKTREQLLDASEVLHRAYDPYAFMRNAYLQRRQFLVTGQQSSGEEEQEEKMLEESGGAEEQPPSPPPQGQPPEKQPQTPPRPPQP